MNEEAPPPESDAVTPPKRRKRMTFIELLVLIAVLSTLLALMVTTLHRPREKALRSYCLSHNLKQIGLAMRLYSGDNQECFPTDASRTAIGSFALLTNVYMRDFTVWVCRSDRGVRVRSASAFTSGNCSYAYGGFGLTEIVLPDTPLACDRSSTGDPSGTTPWSRNRWTHRSDGGNVLYADGHVAFTQPMKVPMYRGKNP